MYNWEFTMVHKNNLSLTKYELEIMQELWAAKIPLNLYEILAKMPRDPKPSHTSLLNLIQSMVKNDYIEQKKQGENYLYSPKAEEQYFVSKEICRISERLFGSGPLSLAMSLIENEQLDREEIEQIKKVLDAS